MTLQDFLFPSERGFFFLKVVVEPTTGGFFLSLKDFFLRSLYVHISTRQYTMVIILLTINFQLIFDALLARHVDYSNLFLYSIQSDTYIVPDLSVASELLEF